MSFKISWDPDLINASNFPHVAALLESALSKGPRPDGVIGPILVDHLYLGDSPPHLHIKSIIDLDKTRFKAVFSMVYAGNASITLRTRVQANLLRTAVTSSSSSSPPGTTTAAAAPPPPPPISVLPSFLGALPSLAMPLQFTIHDFRLKGTVTLVVAKNRGAVLVFQDDPLQSIQISSSLDDLPSVSAKIKAEVEAEIRDVFRDSIPRVIYDLTCPEPTEPAPTVPPPSAAAPPNGFGSHPPNPTSSPPDDSNNNNNNDDDPLNFSALTPAAAAKIRGLARLNDTLSLAPPSLFDANALDALSYANYLNRRPRGDDPNVPHPDMLAMAAARDSLLSSSSSAPATPPSIASSAHDDDTSSVGSSDSTSAKPRKRRVISLRDMFTKRPGSPATSPALSTPSQSPVLTAPGSSSSSSSSTSHVPAMSLYQKNPEAAYALYNEQFRKTPRSPPSTTTKPKYTPPLAPQSQPPQHQHQHQAQPQSRPRVRYHHHHHQKHPHIERFHGPAGDTIPEAYATTVKHKEASQLNPILKKKHHGAPALVSAGPAAAQLAHLRSTSDTALGDTTHYFLARRD